MSDVDGKAGFDAVRLFTRIFTDSPNLLRKPQAWKLGVASWSTLMAVVETAEEDVGYARAGGSAGPERAA